MGKWISPPEFYFHSVFWCFIFTLFEQLKDINSRSLVYGRNGTMSLRLFWQFSFFLSFVNRKLTFLKKMLLEFVCKLNSLVVFKKSFWILLFLLRLLRKSFNFKEYGILLKLQVVLFIFYQMLLPLIQSIKEIGPIT